MVPLIYITTLALAHKRSEEPSGLARPIKLGILAIATGERGGEIWAFDVELFRA